jgi:hypothetical protein
VAAFVENTRTLIRPWAFSAASVSLTTAGVRPSPPIITTGSRWWASARFSLRWAGSVEWQASPYYPTAHENQTKSKKVNKAWLHDHINDPYVKLAQREGYRARAAYKLKEIDEDLS